VGGELDDGPADKDFTSTLSGSSMNNKKKALSTGNLKGRPYLREVVESTATSLGKATILKVWFSVYRRCAILYSTSFLAMRVKCALLSPE
jgi:hypothetical protein